MRFNMLRPRGGDSRKRLHACASCGKPTASPAFDGEYTCTPCAEMLALAYVIALATSEADSQDKARRQLVALMQ
jgi:hypothetical protein